MGINIGIYSSRINLKHGQVQGRKKRMSAGFQPALVPLAGILKERTPFAIPKNGQPK
jgi:hypothetical protein